MRELGLEYRYLADLLEGKIDKSTFEKTISIKNHQYAKRQMIYFKKDPAISWFDVTESSFLNKVEDFILAWYNSNVQ